MAKLEYTKKVKEFMSRSNWADEPGKKCEDKRPSHDEYFMKMAHLVKERSTCYRRFVGAVIVKDTHLLTTGYNGNPKGMKHCEEIGCLRQELKVSSGQMHELCTGVHSEQNAIIQAAVFGVSIKGATMYVTDTPCSVCARMIINAGIKEVVYEGTYPDELAVKLLDDSGVILRKIGSQ